MENSPLIKKRGYTMKKLAVLLLFMLVTFFYSGCFDDSGDKKKDDDKVTTGTIEVKATYTDSVTDTNTGGTEKIFLWLFKEAPANARTEPDYEVITESAAASGTEYTLTIDEIEPGDYYVMLFYDDKLHNQGDAGNTDPYVFYNNAKNPTTATLVTIEKDSTKKLSISFDDTYLIGSDAAFMTDTPPTPTGTATLTVKTTFNGTISSDASATKKLYLYIWNSAPTNGKTPTASYYTSTGNTITAGVEKTLTITGIAAGDYYVMVLYDSASGGSIPNEGDPYEFYNDKANPAAVSSGSTLVTLTADTTTEKTMSFGDTYILNGSAGFD